MARDDAAATGPAAFDATYSTIVVGSGSAALSAALTTAVAGCRTLVLEKTDLVGGTSAMSGGGVWVPANHHARAAGIADSVKEALAYIRAASPPGWEETEAPLWQAFAEASPEMLAFVEAHTPLAFALTGEPDPIPGIAGAKTGGRMVSPRPLPRRVAGRLARHLRPSTQPHIFTYQELVGSDVYHHPIRTALALSPTLLRRWLTGERGQGTALMAGLVAGCLAAGCDIELNCPAVELIRDADGRIRGVVAERDGRRLRFAAEHGVVLASGGFEWDDERLGRHFPGPVDFRAAPRANAGDGHRMAEAVGAAFAHMDQANINSAIPARYEGRPHGMALFYHGEPNAILVDRTGRRFVDEMTFNLGEALDRRDSATGEPVHLPVWIVTDERFIRRSPVIRWYARPTEGWLLRADDIEALAAKMGVPAAALAGTVARFNALCAIGTDEDFHRPVANPHANLSRYKQVRLEPIEPPFVAISFNRSILCTKGGPRTNARGQVLRPDGSVIAGLYCAGATMANPIGTRAVGAGTTLGPNMTWGYICGRSIAAEADRSAGPA
ncbi:MAG: FAD-binding protein [Bauldia sp.]|nr:FAD-binding protein [Bauldia sp.]